MFYKYVSVSDTYFQVYHFRYVFTPHEKVLGLKEKSFIIKCYHFHNRYTLMNHQVLRPLRQWPWFHHHRTCVTLPLHHHHHHLLSPPTPHPPTSKTPPISNRLSFATLASSRPKLRTPNSPLPTTPDADLEDRKSRNELKREARRAVKWGMDLASFSAPQIKRIIRFSVTFFISHYTLFLFLNAHFPKLPPLLKTSCAFCWVVAGSLPWTKLCSKLLCSPRCFFFSFVPYS